MVTNGEPNRGTIYESQLFFFFKKKLTIPGFSHERVNARLTDVTASRRPKRATSGMSYLARKPRALSSTRWVFNVKVQRRWPNRPVQGDP